MEWISVDDRLPIGETCVDVYCNGPQDLEGRLTDVFYDHDKCGWWKHDLKYDVKKYLGVNITHWMQLPEPPKGEINEKI